MKVDVQGNRAHVPFEMKTFRDTQLTGCGLFSHNVSLLPRRMQVPNGNVHPGWRVATQVPGRKREGRALIEDEGC